LNFDKIDKESKLKHKQKSTLNKLSNKEEHPKNMTINLAGFFYQDGIDHKIGV
jgi:hypothetical protein